MAKGPKPSDGGADCGCVNCECEKCGWQNPQGLMGAEAAAAGVHSWDQTWWCDPACGCCSEEAKQQVIEAVAREAKPA